MVREMTLLDLLLIGLRFFFLRVRLRGWCFILILSRRKEAQALELF